MPNHEPQYGAAMAAAAQPATRPVPMAAITLPQDSGPAAILGVAGWLVVSMVAGVSVEALAALVPRGTKVDAARASRMVKTTSAALDLM